MKLKISVRKTSNLELRVLELQAFRKDMKKRGGYCPFMADFHRDFCREEEIRILKETHSKRYLLQHGLVTKKEYREIKGESLYRKEQRKQAAVARIMPRVVVCVPLRRYKNKL